MKAPIEEKSTSTTTNNCCSFIKPSLSMTSLPPPSNSQQDCTELIKAKLRVERPYNSLKKKRNSERDMWRHSWGSGHSHSSCSLHSNTTGIGGLNTGKDEFWAALQTNYNYIMDTNLLDSCKEARCELEDAAITVANTPDCCQKMLLQSSRTEGSAEDPRMLRRWLREMEGKLSKAPSLSEATQMSVRELKGRLTEHSVLYCEIVSHARVVGACVRAFEKENNSNNSNLNSLTSEGNITTSTIAASSSSVATTSNGNRKFDGNLKGLERRYHLLYLKAIEVQCLFEGLLGKKNSSSVLSRSSSTETDDEPASKLARLSDCESNTHVSSSDILSRQHTISDDNKSEFSYIQEDDIDDQDQEIEDEEHYEDEEDQKQRQQVIKHWPNFNFTAGLAVEQHQINADFDADSEGSDCDIVLIKESSNRQQQQYYHNSHNTVKKDRLNRSNKLNVSNQKDDKLSEIMDSSNSYNKNGSLEYKLPVDKKSQHIQSTHQDIKYTSNINRCSANISQQIENNCGVVGVGNIGNSVICNSNNIINSNYNIHNNNNNINNNNNCGTPASGKKRQRIVDISKFNRSNRKSKNCAIFYFKHLDTDNENFGLSSQGSDAIKSGEPSSDDEGWIFSNDCVDGNNQNSTLNNDDSDKENKLILKNFVDIQITPSNIHNMEFITNQKDSTITTVNNNSPAILLNGHINEVNGEQQSHSHSLLKSGSGLNHLKTEIDVQTVTAIGATAINSENNKNTSEAKTVGLSEIVLNKECSHESIKRLVIGAENLVRDEVLKTPGKKHLKISTTIKKREVNMPGPNNIQRVQEWLEHQPIAQIDSSVPFSLPTTDCEASGEYTESSDSAARESDTSEGFTDSVATCMQTGSISQCTSTEIIGGSAEPIPNCGSNPSLTYAKVVRRTNRRNSERPWSVSCLSQLTESDTIISPDKVKANQGLASHSISESALHILSSPGRRKNSPQTPVKNSDSKNSLKRRKTRRRRLMGKKSDSGSEIILPYNLPKITQSLIKSESLNIIQDLTMALSMLSLPKAKKVEEKSTSEMESEEENKLMKPNFKLGSYTKAFLSNESKLGSLAALSNYMHEEQGDNTGTEDHSSFSEQAWDNYQEKYNSENYSEGFDSDAARRLLEFGDDYRNFLDSQSDCCSSLSNANNFDSLSPPRMDSLKQNETKLPQQVVTSTVDHIRRRRTLELEYERRRKSMEMKKKNSQDDIHRARCASGSSLSSSHFTSKNLDRNMNRTVIDSANRKLEFGVNSSSTNNLRKTSDSDNSIRRRKSEDGSSTLRRKSSRTMDKSFKVIPPTSSSSNEDSDDEKEMKSLLSQSRNRLENTNALKIRSHLLRPEDYAEIIATCRDNVRCLEAVLRGPGTVLSTARQTETRELLSSWENLLGWSENAAAARKMQEEMIILKNALNRLGKRSCDFDSESTIQFGIEELKNEKTQLQTYRTNMLRLNASVHSWLTRQELKLNRELEAIALAESEEIDNIANNNSLGHEKSLQINTVAHSESEFHKHLKDEVSDMYSAWDDADGRITNHLEVLTASFIAWRQLECGLSEFHQVLGKDRGTLKGLEGALDKGQGTPIELAQNVKIVAKLLSEKIECNQQQVTVISSDCNDPNRIMPVVQFTSSNGSLSDSGISDGGATSDGGLSERERRLGVLRRLAKQLESALAPGSDALKSIAARMESAEAELKTLQNTCRELIVRTAVSQHKKTQGVLSYNGQIAQTKPQQRNKKSPSPSKRKNKGKTSINGIDCLTNGALPRNQRKLGGNVVSVAPDSGDPDDPKDWELCTEDDDDMGPKGGWAWRVAKIALPVQIALLTLFCAACLLEPHCCDSLNNLSMSFTPQLRYVRGPPPI